MWEGKAWAIMATGDTAQAEYSRKEFESLSLLSGSRDSQSDSPKSGYNPGREHHGTNFHPPEGNENQPKTKPDKTPSDKE